MGERRYPEYPLGLKFHKKTAQIQFDFSPPYTEQENGRPETHLGCVRVTFAKALDDKGKSMDWSNATKMKLGTRDIGLIVARWDRLDAQLAALAKEAGASDRPALFRMVTEKKLDPKKIPRVDLVHKPDDTKTSSLVIECGQNTGTYRVTLTITESGKTDSRSIYLDDVERVLLVESLKAVIPRLLAWAA